MEKKTLFGTNPFQTSPANPPSIFNLGTDTNKPKDQKPATSTFAAPALPGFSTAKPSPEQPALKFPGFPVTNTSKSQISKPEEKKGIPFGFANKDNAGSAIPFASKPPASDFISKPEAKTKMPEEDKKNNLILNQQSNLVSSKGSERIDEIRRDEKPKGIPKISAEELKSTNLSPQKLEDLFNKWRSSLITMANEMHMTEDQMKKYEIQLLETLREVQYQMQNVDNLTKITQQQQDILNIVKSDQVFFANY